MKKKFLVFYILAGMLMIMAPIVFFITYKLASSVLSGDSDSFNRYYRKGMYIWGWSSYYQNLPKALSGKYLLLLQNNRELRATGGFMGSYAILNFADGVLHSWEIQDIYTVDGQIKGHVEPKAPLQQAFQTGTWRLPDSNWEPDFKDASKDILWFFEKGGVRDIKGLIAVNFDFIKSWLGIIGEVKPYDFSETVNKDNFYYLAQSYSENGFFPGAHSKKNYLSGVGLTLFDKTLDGNLIDKMKLAFLILKQLDDKQIFLYSKDKLVEDLITKIGWDGSLGEYKSDYLYSVESNLGVNKANCCVERHIRQNVTIDDKITNETTITITNAAYNNKSDSKVKNSFGGGYKDYHRLIIPSGAKIKSLTVNGRIYNKSSFKDPNNPPPLLEDKTYDLYNYGDLKALGFWVLVPERETAIIKLIYTLPHSNNYSIFIKRQPGIYEFPYILTINDRVVASRLIKKDISIKKRPLF